MVALRYHGKNAHFTTHYCNAGNTVWCHSCELPLYTPRQYTTTHLLCHTLQHTDVIHVYVLVCHYVQQLYGYCGVLAVYSELLKVLTILDILVWMGPYYCHVDFSALLVQVTLTSRWQEVRGSLTNKASDGNELWERLLPLKKISLDGVTLWSESVILSILGRVTDLLYRRH